MSCFTPIPNIIRFPHCVTESNKTIKNKSVLFTMRSAVSIKFESEKKDL